MVRTFDELHADAVILVRKSKRASTAYISRELDIPYTAAIDVMLRLERDGIVSEPNYLGKREILPTEGMNE